MILSRMESKKKAVEYFDIALSIDPDFDDARREKKNILQRWEG